MCFASASAPCPLLLANSTLFPGLGLDVASLGISLPCPQSRPVLLCALIAFSTFPHRRLITLRSECISVQGKAFFLHKRYRISLEEGIGFV